MIRARFFTQDGAPCGFCIRGHAGLDAAGRDILCAAVSSAAILAANTLTEESGIRALVREKDGYLYVWVVRKDRERSRAVLSALRRHLIGLFEAYPTYLQVETTEV